MLITLVRGDTSEPFELVPSKIIGIGTNYRAHAVEMGKGVPEEPLMFLKPRSAVISDGASIERPAGYERVDYEGELGVVIGTRTRGIARARALEAVLGFVCVNDVTVRDLQKRDGQWSRAKGFDTFCPLGPVIDTDLDLEHGTIETSVNGELRKQGRLADMVHSIPAIIAYASSVFTLLPGDVILTGTPAGVGPIVDGDTVDVTVSGLGTLSNPVRSAS
jgi:2-keto-4-pentenoate hydratase/2-oxohepta-3-ene-1,7-dioic acid hydratase in catechol pathway